MSVFISTSLTLNLPVIWIPQSWVHKKKARRTAWLHFAEEEGFEPPEPHGSTVFKTAAIDHSATPLDNIHPRSDGFETANVKLSLIFTIFRKQKIQTVKLSF
jgi:hypothetical protein